MTFDVVKGKVTACLSTPPVFPARAAARVRTAPGCEYRGGHEIRLRPNLRRATPPVAAADSAMTRGSEGKPATRRGLVVRVEAGGSAARAMDSRQPAAVPAADRPVRVLLVDDHPVLREGIKACLVASPGIDVVGEVADGAAVLEVAKALAPDVVLMDLNLPRLNGLEATALLRRELPRVRILVFTIHHEPQYVAQVIRSGAHGYLTKDAPPRELVAALRGVGSGGTYFSSEVAQLFLNAQLGGPGRNRGASLQTLSARESEVLKLIAEGVGNKQIAVRLGVSPRTVETHRERIMRKLDLHSVAALTRFAIAEGLVGLE